MRATVSAVPKVLFVYNLVEQLLVNLAPQLRAFKFQALEKAKPIAMDLQNLMQ